MAGETLPVFDRRVTLRTVTQGEGAFDAEGIFQPGETVNTDVTVGASIQRSTVQVNFGESETQPPLRRSVEDLDLLIRDNATGRAFWTRWETSDALSEAARAMIEGRAYSIQAVAPAPEFGRRRVLRLELNPVIA